MKCCDRLWPSWKGKPEPGHSVMRYFNMIVVYGNWWWVVVRVGDRLERCVSIVVQIGEKRRMTKSVPRITKSVPTFGTIRV
jgi:hypothetical protein